MLPGSDIQLCSSVQILLLSLYPLLAYFKRFLFVEASMPQTTLYAHLKEIEVCLHRRRGYHLLAELWWMSQNGHDQCHQFPLRCKEKSTKLCKVMMQWKCNTSCLLLFYSVMKSLQHFTSCRTYIMGHCFFVFLGVLP